MKHQCVGSQNVKEKKTTLWKSATYPEASTKIQYNMVMHWKKSLKSTKELDQICPTGIRPLANLVRVNLEFIAASHQHFQLNGLGVLHGVVASNVVFFLTSSWAMETKPWTWQAMRLSKPQSWSKQLLSSITKVVAPTTLKVYLHDHGKRV